MMITPNTTVVGIDISKATLDAGLFDGSWADSFTNDAAGIARLIKVLTKRFQCLVVGLEPSGGYERKLIAGLLKAGIEARFADARRVRQLAQAYNAPAKTDAIDASFIARFIIETGGVVIKIDPALKALGEIMAARATLVEQAQRLEQVMTGTKEPTAKRALASVLKSMKTRIKVLEQRATEHVRAHARLHEASKRLQTAPGVGPIVAMTLLAEMPELGILNSKQIARLAGLAPFIRESGQWRGRATCSGGRTVPRNMLYLAAMAAKRCNPTYKAWFDRLVANHKPKMVALNALMRKLLTSLNAMIRDQKDWGMHMPA
jgi:transposase